MRKLILFLLFAGSVAAIWIMAAALKFQPGPDRTLETSSLAGLPPVETPQLSVFTLSSAEAAGSCMVVRGATLSPGYFELKVNPACETIMPGLTTARFWRERANGTVAFVDGQNAPVAEFAAGDGADFESYRPRSSRLSMWAE